MPRRACDVKSSRAAFLPSSDQRFLLAGRARLSCEAASVLSYIIGARTPTLRSHMLAGRCTCETECNYRDASSQPNEAFRMRTRHERNERNDTYLPRLRAGLIRINLSWMPMLI